MRPESSPAGASGAAVTCPHLLMKECLEKIRVDMPPGQAPVVGLDARLAGLAADHHLGMFEMKGIVRTSLSECEHTLKPMMFPPRPARPARC